MRRGLYKTDAVVLNSFDFGESDRIIAFCTRDFGKIKGVAKGARRSRKRFVGKLDPPCLVSLVFFHNDSSDLVRIEEVSLMEAYNDLKADITILSEACYLLELTSEMTREGVISKGVYELLVVFLRMLGEDQYRSVALRFFEIKLLTLLGIMPHMEGCVVCRKAFGQDAMPAVFSSDKGGAICVKCSNGIMGRLPDISAGTVRLLEAVSRFDLDKIRRLKPDAAVLEQCDEVLGDFITHQLERELKTRKFMAKLRSAAAY